MGKKPYKDWEEVKKDIVNWRRANLCCIVIGLLFVLAGVATELLDIDFALGFLKTGKTLYLKQLCFYLSLS